MLAEEANNSEGVAETDVILMVFPKPDFDRLVAEEETFRKFVFYVLLTSVNWSFAGCV